MKDLAAQLAQIVHQHQWDKHYENLLQSALKDPDVQSFLTTYQIPPESAVIKRNLDAIYEFVHAKGQAHFTGDYQPHLIWVNQTIHVSYQPDAALRQRQRQQYFQQKFQTIDMASDVRQASLEDFAQGAEGRLAAYVAALEFVATYSQHSGEFIPGLYLAGDFGVGKTYLLAAIASELVHKDHNVLLVHFPTFAVQMKNAIGDNSVLERVHKIQAVPILMLDDLGADALSSWIRDEVLGVILQYRMQEKLPTFFSSNFTMHDLKLHLSVNQRGDQEPIKAARIMERIRFLAREVIVAGPNRRFEK